ncbi:MAG: TIGR00730 family Rossman fold protein [Aerococcaceae bacterium]|nr:TIGR00730 family Rossman fold protein [Aerococcaceae bacterium]
MNITIYCGASFGNDECYATAARKIGQWIADNGHSLVYGGSKVGLMGIVADTVLANGAEAIGVMPAFLQEKELAHESLSQLHIVDDMSQRKRKMIELGDVYMALPGGPGTLEEISEVISWSRIGQNANPCILFNENGYYDCLQAQFQRMVDNGFLTQDDYGKILFSSDLEVIQAFIERYEPPKSVY